MSDDESESGSDASEGTPDYLSAKIKPHMDAVQPQVKLALQSIVSLYRTCQVIVSHLQTMSHSSKHLGEDTQASYHSLCFLRLPGRVLPPRVM